MCKKIILLIALAISIILTSCNLESTKPTLIGTWYIDDFGGLASNEELKSGSLKINDDDTFLLKMTIKQNALLVYIEKEQEFKGDVDIDYDDKTLTLKSDDSPYEKYDFDLDDKKLKLTGKYYTIKLSK